jgi:hypothetical protein
MEPMQRLFAFLLMLMLSAQCFAGTVSHTQAASVAIGVVGLDDTTPLGGTSLADAFAAQTSGSPIGNSLGNPLGDPQQDLQQDNNLHADANDPVILSPRFILQPTPARATQPRYVAAAMPDPQPARLDPPPRH